MSETGTTTVIAEQGPVRVIFPLNLTVRYANRYSIECAKCGGVQGVKTRREALATLKGHHRICVEPVHQATIGADGVPDVSWPVCGNTGTGTVAGRIWDVTCADCKRLRGN